MATEKQIEANRRNAQASTGPRTEAGKEASRGNALKHGMRAEVFEVLPNEDPAEFAARVAAWEHDLKPVGEAEAHLARRAAAIVWKLDRLERVEAASLTRRIRDAVDGADCDDDDLDALHEAADIASFDPGVEAERMRRYQAGLTRELHRTLDLLIKLKKERLKCANEANSAARSAVAQGSRAQSAAPAPNEPKSGRPNEANSPTGRLVTGGVMPKTPTATQFDSLPFELSLAPGDANSTAWRDFSVDRG